MEYGPGWFHSEKDLMIICLVPLQVANLPLETTRGELENVFSELGPIKKCFVLKPKEGKKSNLGFVTFAMSGDCKAAAVSIITLSYYSFHNLHLLFELFNLIYELFNPISHYRREMISNSMETP